MGECPCEDRDALPATLDTHFDYVEVPERPKGRVCKTLKPSVRIRPSTPNFAGKWL